MSLKYEKITVLHSGVLPIGNVEIPCFVLNDGRRILSGRGMQNALRLTDDVPQTQQPGTRLARLFNSQTLKPFLHDELEPDRFKSILCFDGNKRINGYEATVLSDICDSVLEARKQGVLNNPRLSRMAIVADQCELLLRAFAKVGIIALVDEATGYQDTRVSDKTALRKLLDKYLRQEFASWAKRFPDEFYERIFSLRGWSVDEALTKRPSVVGRYTNDIVYERLAPGILTELQSKNPIRENGTRGHKHHQLLTDEVGHPALQSHLTGVMALMRASASWNGFMRSLSLAYPKLNDTLMLNLEDSD